MGTRGCRVLQGSQVNPQCVLTIAPLPHSLHFSPIHCSALDGHHAPSPRNGRHFCSILANPTMFTLHLSLPTPWCHSCTAGNSPPAPSTSGIQSRASPGPTAHSSLHPFQVSPASLATRWMARMGSGAHLASQEMLGALGPPALQGCRVSVIQLPAWGLLPTPRHG